MDVSESDAAGGSRLMKAVSKTRSEFRYRIVVHAGSVVSYDHHCPAGLAATANRNVPFPFLSLQAVLECVLHQRLEGKPGNWSREDLGIYSDRC